MSKISNREFGFFKNKQIILTTLNSEQNTKVSFMNWGASIQNWIINHPQDGIVSAVLGFEDFERKLVLGEFGAKSAKSKF